MQDEPAVKRTKGLPRLWRWLILGGVVVAVWQIGLALNRSQVAHMNRELSRRDDLMAMQRKIEAKKVGQTLRTIERAGTQP